MLRAIVPDSLLVRLPRNDLKALQLEPMLTSAGRHLFGIRLERDSMYPETVILGPDPVMNRLMEDYPWLPVERGEE